MLLFLPCCTAARSSVRTQARSARVCRVLAAPLPARVPPGSPVCSRVRSTTLCRSFYFFFLWWGGSLLLLDPQSCMPTFFRHSGLSTPAQKLRALGGGGGTVLCLMVISGVRVVEDVLCPRRWSALLGSLSVKHVYTFGKSLGGKG